MKREPNVIGLDGCAAKSVDRQRVAAAQRRLITSEEAIRLAALFRLLADPTRMRLLYSLLEAGELCVCDLAATIGTPETSVSHALRLLRVAGVVRARRAGRMIFYTLADAHVRLLLDLSREHMAHEAGAVSRSDARLHGAVRRGRSARSRARLARS